MSEDLFYNRDRNIQGVVAPTHLSGLELTPSYGSQASFEAKNHSYETDDFYFNMVPLSLNSLNATFSVAYSVSETNAQKLANFFESRLFYLLLMLQIKFIVSFLSFRLFITV